MGTSAEMKTVTSREMTEKKVPPIFVEVRIQGKPVKMLLDTDAVVSAIDETEFKSRFPEVSMEPSDLKLRGYFGQPSSVSGKAMVNA
ncbi:hypothetical protein HPB49_022380 [Dermacentor silvarum]|uniref:Uncharacterized protein n=1 Tax=Dermacentor silvarum TaxID=543639 RepID=A0ACB8DQN2_DERSI|nr:hypothetical protein HPB49_022380 [Dermacentor silvarum]